MAFQNIPGFNFYLGWAYYHLEEYENALLYLDKAITGEAEPLGFAYYLNADPIFDELKGNTTFIELTQMLGFDK